MAKDSDKRTTELDDAQGLLSGFLADEDELDRRALWRLGTWAVVSVGAVIVAVLANQSSIGWRREQIASAELLRQSQQLQQVAKESQNDSRGLAAAIETLNGDRDRLYSRVAVLEQGLDSVTGAISRQSSASASMQTAPQQANAAPAAPAAQAAAATRPSTSATAAAPPTPTPGAPAATTASVAPEPVDGPPAALKPQQPAPTVSPVATTAANPAEKPAAPEKPVAVATGPDANPKPAPAKAAQAMPPAPAAATLASASPPSPATSLAASKSIIGPPDPAAGKPTPPASPPPMVAAAPKPEVVASIPPVHEQSAPDAVTTTTSLAVQRTEFGVDIGGANSISGLRALWRGLLRSKANAALKTLRPIIVIKESSNGLGMQLRLVAGPIDDAAAAAKICASLSNNDRGCSTTVFEGQRLAVDESDEVAKADTSTTAADPKPAAAGRTSYHRRYVPKYPPTEAPPPPPQPEPSTLSRLFGAH